MIDEQLLVVLETLFLSSQEQLLSPDFKLKLMLPDDDALLCERLEALVLWVQGFLSAFSREMESIPSIAESVSDLRAILNLETEQVEGEENERDYYELSEYVRMVVIHCFIECQARQNTDSRDLH